MNVIIKNISEKLFLFLIPALFTFPLFKENISSIIFISLSVNTIIYNILTKSYKKNFQWSTLYYCIPFFVVLFFVMIDSLSKENLKHLNHALFFLLFPIIFTLIPKTYFSEKKLDSYFKILRSSCLIIAVGFVAAFLYKYDFSDFFVYKYGIPKFRDFVYYEIPFFVIHPTYYTAIVVFCTAYSLEKVLKEKKYIEILYVFAFILITFLVLAKINILYIAVLLTLMLLFRSRFTIRQKITSILFLFVIGTLLIFLIPGVKNRFSEIYRSFNNPPKNLSYDSTNVRVAITTCSFEIAKENYLFGVGFDNLEDKLYECFKVNYDSSFYENHKYLTHNYFYYIFLSTGIIGLLSLLFYCYRVALEVKKINRFLLYVVIINVFFICLTEDYFYRHYGIFYFNLILMTFINHSKYLLSYNNNKLNNK